MTERSGPDWIDRAVAWLSALLFGPEPSPRAVRITRDPDPRELARRGIQPPRRF